MHLPVHIRPSRRHPGTARRHPVDERGSGTVLSMGVVVVVLALLVAGSVLGRYAVAVHRARGAADLAALAAAGAYHHSAGSGAEACRVAVATARANAAEVTRCSVVGDVSDFAATVQTRVAVGRHWPGLPSAVRARGVAGPVRDTGPSDEGGG